MRSYFACLLLLSSLVPGAGIAAGDAPLPAVDGSYVVQRQYILGGPGGWDCLTIDPAAERLYIARADRVLVVNTRGGSLSATIPHTEGVHAIALAPQLGRGFISNGHTDTVTVFDLKSLDVVDTIPVGGHNPDAILYDQASGHLYTFNGASRDISVIDPRKRAVIANLVAGGKPEFAAADGAGRIYFNIEDNSQIGVIDSSAGKRIATWSLAQCDQPSGLALDVVHKRLFSACANEVMAVTDATSGKFIARIPIGKGPDGAAFDAVRELLFSPNGKDGTLTVIHEDDPDHYSVVAQVITQKSARTMALDEKTHRIFLVAAEFEPAPAPNAVEAHPRPRVIDGTFKVLVVGNEVPGRP
jgi:YVTN family beta-propeller protein